MEVHRLSRQQARQVAVRAQLLDAPRPAGLLEVVGHLTLLQVDLTEAVAPSADLVLWSRLGPAYSPIGLDAAFEAGALVEFRATIRPATDIALLRAEMAAWPGRGDLRPWQAHVRDWVAANDACRRDILDRLRESGPLAAQDIPDTCVVPWESTGWTNNRNVMKMLEFMESRGEVAITGHGRRGRLWELAERIYPDVAALPIEEAARIRAQRALGALGIARTRWLQTTLEPVDMATVGEAAVVEGVKGMWRVDPTHVGAPFTGRAALLSPLDRLVFDRQRLLEIFEFDYQLEMYKPAAKRRWGYWALPILHGDRLVGKLDATADREARVLRINEVHQDVPFDAAMEADVDREIADLARWLRLSLR